MPPGPPDPQDADRPQRPLTLVLADDHPVVRTGMRTLLEAVPGWRVVAEAADADAALAAVGEHRPGILVLDLLMPGRPSLDVLPELAGVSPETRTLILTMDAEPSVARRALSAGAAAYVLKDAADEDLVHAVAVVAGGGAYLDPGLGAALAAPPAERDAVDRLSDREREVLRLIALGHTNPEIAELLTLSLRTVETHRAHIQAKSGRTRRADLVALALAGGLLGDHRITALRT